MPSYYSVLQYAPRPLADERINFGVVCFNDTLVRARILSSWSRVQTFAHSDIQFLKDFASHLQDAVRQVEAAPGAPIPSVWSRSDIEDMAHSWSNSIQLTSPRASLLGVEALLDSIYCDFVDELTRHASEGRGRRDAKLDLLNAVRSALQLRLSKKQAAALLSRGELEGRAEAHRFDAIVANGKPVFVAHALSFETDDFVPSDERLRSLAFRIEDVRKLQPDLPFGIYALPPEESSKTVHAQERFALAKQIFDSVETRLIPENEFERWLTPLADAAAARAAAAA